MPRKKSVNQARSRVASNLKRLRLEKDYSQVFVSEHLGKTDYTAYQRLESGKTELKLEDAVKLAELYKISVERIWDEQRDGGLPVDIAVSENSREYVSPVTLRHIQIQIQLDGSDELLNDQIDLLISLNKALKKKSAID